jgi:glucosamine--fructose-6-phosphate aminotransferase (isomerizing)
MTKYNFDMLCGREISVASTKAFMSTIYFFYALFNFENEINKIIKSLEKVIIDEEKIKEFAEKFKDENHLILIGRGLDGLINNENILKIKEVTYLNVDSYYGGELKHGPLALINNNSSVFVLNTNNNTNNITRTNTEEILARGGKCYIFSSTDTSEENDFYNFLLSDDNSVFSVCLYFQLFAYFLALAKNNNPDRPKNLAKSVTVE